MNVQSRATDRDVLLSVRETRMIVERILLTLNVPQGFVPAVGNCILYSQAQRLGGLAAFREAMGSLAAGRLGEMKLRQEGNGLILDGGSNHAWLIANDALDLALAESRLGRGDVLEVCNVRDTGELRVIEGLAERHRARAQVQIGESGAVLRILADRLPGEDAVMGAALRDGFTVSRALWRSLYDRSGEALTPDSIESRRHAGPVMVDAQGRVHGRDDDDTDFELLLGQKAASSNQ
jgi:hypothetical protein